MAQVLPAERDLRRVIGDGDAVPDGEVDGLTEHDLLVRSGPFRWRVPLGQIHSVTPTRNPLSSPALSLDRLRIEYGDGKWILISPRERERFLEALEARGVRDLDVSPARGR